MRGSGYSYAGRGAAVISAGDEEFDRFCRQQYPSLLRWLRARGASLPDAEDAAQSAFIQVWCRWPGLRHPGGYLYCVAAHELGRLGKARTEPDTIASGSDCLA